MILLFSLISSERRIQRGLSVHVRWESVDPADEGNGESGFVRICDSRPGS
jgi:hypothetical protein